MIELNSNNIIPIIISVGVFIVCYYNCCTDRRENYMRTIVNPRLLAEIDDEDRMEEGNYDNNYIFHPPPNYPPSIISRDELPKYDDIINDMDPSDVNIPTDVSIPNDVNIPNDVFLHINQEPPVNTESPPKYTEC